MSHFKKAFMIILTGVALQADDLPYFNTKEMPARDSFKKGLIHLYANRYSAAKENFIRALSVKEDFILAREYLSSAYFLGGQWLDSLNELEILDSQNKLNPVLKNRAEFLRLLLGGIPHKNEIVYEKTISGDDYRGYRFSNPVDAALDDKGNLYVLSYKTANIIKFNPTGNPINNIKGSLGRNMQGPVALAWFKRKLYIADLKADQVVIFSDRGTYVKNFGTTGSNKGQFHGPSGIAVNETGIYVADAGNNRIQKFNLEGEFLQEFGHITPDHLQSPAGITTYKKHIFVADKGNRRVMEYDNEGYFIQSFRNEDFIRPRSLLIKNDKMYITDEKAGIFIYSFHDKSWSKWENFIDDKGFKRNLEMPFSLASDYTESYYAVDFNRHRLDVFTPKSKLLSNLDVFIEKIDMERYKDMSVFLRVKNRSNQEIKGIDRLSFRLFENGNPSPLIGLANMEKYNQQITVSLVYENSPEVLKIHKSLDYIFAPFFKSFTVNDRLEMIRAGKDTTLVYNYGHSMYDVFSIIRNSRQESRINLGKAIHHAITDLTAEIGPRAVIVLVSGKNNEIGFNQYNNIRLIQYAKAHSIPLYILTLDKSSVINRTYRKIARSTGGLFLQVPGNPQVNDLYKHILAQKDNRYIVSFKSQVDSSLTGRYIPISVDVRYRNQYGKAEAGYFIPESQ